MSYSGQGHRRQVAQHHVPSDWISKGRNTTSGQPVPISNYPLSEVFHIFKYNFLHFSLCLLTGSASESSSFQADNPSTLSLPSHTKHSNPLGLTLPLTLYIPLYPHLLYTERPALDTAPQICPSSAEWRGRITSSPAGTALPRAAQDVRCPLCHEATRLPLGQPGVHQSLQGLPVHSCCSWEVPTQYLGTLGTPVPGVVPPPGQDCNFPC